MKIAKVILGKQAVLMVEDIEIMVSIPIFGLIWIYDG